MSLPLEATLTGGLRCSSVVSRDVVTVAEAAEANDALLLLRLPGLATDVLGCNINKCGLNKVAVVVVADAAAAEAGLELVTALGCTGEDGSSGMAVRVDPVRVPGGVEALLTYIGELPALELLPLPISWLLKLGNDYIQ